MGAKDKHTRNQEINQICNNLMQAGNCLSWTLALNSTFLSVSIFRKFLLAACLFQGDCVWLSTRSDFKVKWCSRGLRHMLLSQSQVRNPLSAIIFSDGSVHTEFGLKCASLVDGGFWSPESVGLWAEYWVIKKMLEESISKPLNSNLNLIFKMMG